MKSVNTNPANAPTPANGRKDGSKEQASNTASNAKPCSSRSAHQGEKKTTGGK